LPLLPLSLPFGFGSGFVLDFDTFVLCIPFCDPAFPGFRSDLFSNRPHVLIPVHQQPLGNVAKLPLAFICEERRKRGCKDRGGFRFLGRQALDFVEVG
jgi:hypothetical protein